MDPDPKDRDEPQPDDTAGPVANESVTLPPQQLIPLEELDLSEPDTDEPAPRVQRRLRDLLDNDSEIDPDKKIDFMVSFRQDVVPSPEVNTLGERLARLSFIGLRPDAATDPGERNRLAELLPVNKIELIEEFGSLRLLMVRAPLNVIEVLVDEAEENRDSLVSYIELRFAGERPPHGTVTLPGVDVGADLIKSASYRSRPTQGERIALLDTGVDPSRATAGVLSRVEKSFTCFVDKQECKSDATTDSRCDLHGTFVAAVLSADTTNTLFQGITTAPIHSFNVYAWEEAASLEPAHCQLDAFAAVRALDYVANHSADYTVVAALLQGERADPSGIVGAARLAFEAGISVIAPTGNFDGTVHSNSDDGNVLAPALGSRVIGVGAVLADSPTVVDSLQRSGQENHRTKPDVQGPTRYRPLANSMAPLDATSGATPFVAGAAVLLHNWLRSQSGAPRDPGMVYALLLLSGQGATVHPSNGAGLISLPPEQSIVYRERISLHSGKRQCIPIVIPGSGMRPQRLDAAIWWPDEVNHRKLYLEVFDSANATDPVAFSDEESSVFQRVQHIGPLPGQTWYLRVSWMAKEDSTIPPLDVYCAAAVRPS